MKQPPKPWPRPRLSRWGTIEAAASIVGLATLVGFGGRWNWFFELFSHFRLQYLGLLVCATIAEAFARRWGQVAWMAPLALVNLALLAPYHFGADSRPSTGPSLRILACNVNSQNQQYTPFLDLVKATNPDVVLVIEIDDSWERALGSLKNSYPHSLVEARDDNFGIACFSRVAPERLNLSMIGSAGLPSVVAKLEFDDAPLTIIGTHPLPPIGAENARLRNEQLAALATKARDSGGSVAIVGDLNITSYSPFFGDLLAQGKLRDSRQGRGLQASWRNLTGVTWIPIDHCLVSPDLVVRDRRVGSDVGSDHYPIIIDLGRPDGVP